MSAGEHRVSVGHLAAFVHRGGDLGPSGQPSVRALEGLRRQQRHQAGAGARHACEVRLCGTWVGEGIQLAIGGRADGVLSEPGRVCIEEIKTVRGDVSAARERAGAMHDAQLRLYGALWLLARGSRHTPEQAPETPAPALQLRVIYLDADLETTTCFDVDASAAGLLAFFDDTCRSYARWLRAERELLDLRDRGLADLPFPHGDFRPGQRTLARAVWQTLGEGGTLLAEAPTGIGKTLGVLYAALRRLPSLAAERVLYLTARGSGRALALSAAASLNAAGARIRAVELTARERICPTPGTPCNARCCDRALGHHDRSRDALRTLLGHGPAAAEAPAEPVRLVDAARISDVATQHRVCPAALQHAAARFCDLVIADYNFAFDPFARQRALLDPDDGGAVVLVDEAHNLVDRAREMHSALLDAGNLGRLASEARTLDCPWAPQLGALLRALQDVDEDVHGAPFRRLLARCEPLAVALSAWLALAPAGPPTVRFQQLLGDLLRFADVAAAATGREGRAWCAIRDQGPDAARSGPDAVRLALRCLSPAPRFAADAAQCAALVLFSATLQPLAAQRDQLGLPADSRFLTVPCPFPPARRLLLRITDLDLRARARGASLPKVVAVIRDLLRARPGNHLVFVPSFAYLQQLVPALERALVPPPMARGGDVPVTFRVLAQERAMSETARAAFVDAFRDARGDCVGVAVSGGLFAEGIDLPGDQLTGVVVVGLPVPAPDVERRALQDYHGAAGFDVAYRIPALTRLRQAAGRLIRTETDSGVICLIDDRLGQPEHVALLPSDWCPEALPAAAVGARVRRFRETIDQDTLQPSLL